MFSVASFKSFYFRQRMAQNEKKHESAYPTLPPGYTIIKKLGKGGYSNVYHCRELSTGRDLAVKQLQADDRGIPAVMEANIMKGVCHQHLASAEAVIADGRNLFIFQRKARCDLGRLTRSEQHLPSPYLLRHWAFALVQAIACLHQRNIVHADIKASNILVFDEEVSPGVPLIKLADFNLAYKMRSSRLNFRICTCTHRPLEVWLGQDWDLSVDIWSLGCTLFEMAYGAYLFPYQGWEDETVPKWLLRDRFVACLENFSQKGPSGIQRIPFSYKAENVKYVDFQLPKNFYHPNYTVFNGLLLSMLRFNPSERPKIGAILTHPYFHGLVKVGYQMVSAPEEPLSSKREQRYLMQIKEFTNNPEVIDVGFSLIRKIQHLRFRYPGYDDDKLRILGCYWLANKLILRRPPGLPYPTGILHRIERKICEYLSYCLVV